MRIFCGYCTDLDLDSDHIEMKARGQIHINRDGSKSQDYGCPECGTEVSVITDIADENIIMK